MSDSDSSAISDEGTTPKEIKVTVEGVRFPKSELHNIERKVAELLQRISYDPAEVQTQGMIEIGGYEKATITWS